VGPKPMLGMEMAYLFGRAPGKLEWECSKWGKFSRSRVVNLTMKFLEVGCWTFMDFWILLVSSETVSWRSQAQGLRSLTEILEGQVVGRIPGDPASAVASCEPGQLTEETPPPLTTITSNPIPSLPRCSASLLAVCSTVLLHTSRRPRAASPWAPGDRVSRWWHQHRSPNRPIGHRFHPTNLGSESEKRSRALFGISPLTNHCKL
jgi:hypothetical protein